MVSNSTAAAPASMAAESPGAASWPSTAPPVTGSQPPGIAPLPAGAGASPATGPPRPRPPRTRILPCRGLSAVSSRTSSVRVALSRGDDHITEHPQPVQFARFAGRATVLHHANDVYSASVAPPSAQV